MLIIQIVTQNPIYIVIFNNGVEFEYGTYKDNNGVEFEYGTYKDNNILYIRLRNKNINYIEVFDCIEFLYYNRYNIKLRYDENDIYFYQDSITKLHKNLKEISTQEHIDLIEYIDNIL